MVKKREDLAKAGETEKFLAYILDYKYYKLKTGIEIGVSTLIGYVASLSIGAIVGAGLCLGVTVFAVVAVIAAAAIASYFITKGLEHLDERYKNKKKEWFE